MKEIWKDIEGYEGYYQVSNLGEIKSLERVTIQGKLLKEKLIKSSDNHNKYLYVSLFKDGNRKAVGVHRLVAQAFIPNPENKPQVNHIDENTMNNNSENLEWVTGKENSNYGNHNKHLSEAQERTAVIAVDIKSHVYRFFNSQHEAERVLGVNHSNIKKVLDGKFKQCNGYKFFRETITYREYKNE